MITFRHLTTFLAVADCKKMSTAAKQLFISQPTVSQTIAEIEHEYQLTLFERYPKELMITPAGKIFYDYASSIVRSFDAMDQAMHTSEFLLPLRIGATLTVGNTILSPLLAELKKRNEHIDLHVQVDNTSRIESKLLHNELDIALVEGIITNDAITTYPVINDTMVVICGSDHPFAKREEVKIDELRHEALIVREQGSGTRSMLLNLLAEHQVPANVKWEVCSGTAILNAVGYGHGVSYISKRCASGDLASGFVHEVPIKDCTLTRSFFLAYHKNKTITQPMSDFIQLVQDRSSDCE